MYAEKFLVDPRHVEFQILADNGGRCIHLFERECSIQRRHQKIIEETPSTALDDDLRKRMGEDAVKVARTAGYTNAGTVEFLLDNNGHYYFLEMNTRIQVEHPITEVTTGVDLVIEQIRIAAGEPLSEDAVRAVPRGHAIECRLYAEDGENNFLPSAGTLLHYSEPSGPGIRVDSGVERGSVVTVDYDPIMAKLIVHAPDRTTAIMRMIDALKEYRVLGVRTSRRFMIEVLSHPEFKAGNTHTCFIERHFDVLAGADRQLRLVSTAAAAVAASVGSMNSDGGMYHSASPDQPWQTIGRWQIGDSIDGTV